MGPPGRGGGSSGGPTPKVTQGTTPKDSSSSCGPSTSSTTTTPTTASTSAPPPQPQSSTSSRTRRRRRPPPRPERKGVPAIWPHDVYVGHKSNFKSVVTKCQKLIETGKYPNVYLHGLAGAIPRTLNIAQELKKGFNGTVDFATTTSTVKVIDDLIPDGDLTEPSYEARNVSRITIRLFRTVNIP